MRNTALAQAYYTELSKIQDQDTSLQSRTFSLRKLLAQIFLTATQDERIQFNTLFARIAYAGHRYQLDKILLYRVHRFRSLSQAPKADLEIYDLGLRCIADAVEALFGLAVPHHLEESLKPRSTFRYLPVEAATYKSLARGIVVEKVDGVDELLFIDEDMPDRKVRLAYNIPDRNDIFNGTINVILKQIGFPVTLHLVGVEITKEYVYRPKAIVLEPDYLVDVTSIAECFQNYGASPLTYLLKKFLPFQNSIPLMIGNIANFFLDELMTNPEASFKEIFPRVFRLNPLAFASLPNKSIREIMQKAQGHFIRLKQMVHQGFLEQDIEPEHCFLEPSFFSQRYGLQGRLDVFYRPLKPSKNPAIVELKSGTPYMPNQAGLSVNHYTQTLLYDMLVKSVFGDELNAVNYILYSGVENRPLRFAPVVNAQQLEALAIRNQLIAIEYAMADLLHNTLENPTLLDLLRPESLPKAKGFVSRDLKQFASTYQGLRQIDKNYLLAYCAFIAKEHLLAKVGRDDKEEINGLAGLWLKDAAAKEESFEILANLELSEQNTQAEDPLLTFKRSAQTNPMANFRNGDIAVLYPYEESGQNALTNQIFKCTVVDLSEERVTIRLRSKQFNVSLFQANSIWSLEHDLLDTGFNNMYRSLWQFMNSDSQQRDLLLTITPPAPASLKPLPRALSTNGQLTSEQAEIFRKIIAAQDYFLLWGPPGTGKTSIMLRHLVAYWLNETDDEILLLAYTNRAVDEICAAIESIDIRAREEYIRIGSRYSTANRFRG